MQTRFENNEQGLSLCITITEPLGLHARPAARLVEELKDLNASFQVRCGDNQADAKSIVDLLTLGASSGSELFFYASGTDAPTGLARIAEFFSTGSRA